jgi:Zn finger protein HypA/HybF involved in hydrogenase expression
MDYSAQSLKTSMGTGGGIPLISSQDIAACLGRIQATGPALLVRTMAGDLSSLKPLQQAFRQHVAHMAMLKHWSVGPNFSACFEGLCVAALHLYLIPDTCGRCEGRGSVQLQTMQVIDCPVCKGVGHRDVKEEDKARIASIPFSFWLNTWADR